MNGCRKQIASNANSGIEEHIYQNLSGDRRTHLYIRIYPLAKVNMHSYIRSLAGSVPGRELVEACGGASKKLKKEPGDLDWAEAFSIHKSYGCPYS